MADIVCQDFARRANDGFGSSALITGGDGTRSVYAQLRSTEERAANDDAMGLTPDHLLQCSRFQPWAITGRKLRWPQRILYFSGADIAIGGNRDQAATTPSRILTFWLGRDICHRLSFKRIHRPAPPARHLRDADRLGSDVRADHLGVGGYADAHKHGKGIGCGQCGVR